MSSKTHYKVAKHVAVLLIKRYCTVIPHLIQRHCLRIPWHSPAGFANLDGRVLASLYAPTGSHINHSMLPFRNPQMLACLQHSLALRTRSGLPLALQYQPLWSWGVASTSSAPHLLARRGLQRKSKTKIVISCTS